MADATAPAAATATAPPSPGEPQSVPSSPPPKKPDVPPFGASPGGSGSPPSPAQPESAAVAPAFDWGFTASDLPPVKTVARRGIPGISYDWGDELLSKFVEKVNVHSSITSGTLGPVDASGPPPTPATIFPGLPTATIEAEKKAVASSAAGAPAAASGGRRSTYRRPPSEPKQKVLHPSFSKHRPSTRRQLV